MKCFMFALLAALTLALGAAPADAQLLLTGAGRSSAGVAIPGTTLIALTNGASCVGCPSTAPTVRYNPQFSTVTAPAGRVSTITDLMGTANATAGTETNWAGPLDRVDLLGRRHMRLQTNEYLTGGTGFTIASGQSRSLTVCGVFRFHRTQGTSPVFSLGSHEAGTQINMGGGASVELYGTSNVGPILRAGGINPLGQANQERIIPGSQMQSLCVVSRGAGVTWVVDGEKVTTSSTIFNTTTVTTGFEIGRYSWAPGSAGTGSPQSDGAGAAIDIYDIAIWKTPLSDAEAVAVSNALDTQWNLVATTNQVVVDGDSITQGIRVSGGADPVTSGLSMGMWLTEPGSPYALPRTYRVVNVGISGNTVAAALTRRDTANSIYNFKLSGANVVAIQIGTNDINPSAAATIYSAKVNLIGQATTGYLARGWTVRSAVNIAISNTTLQAKFNTLRGLERNIAQFRTDTGASAAQLAIIDLPGITVGATHPLDQSADINTGYYQLLVDGTHPNGSVGTPLMVSGGDTPANGYSYAVQH